MCPVLPVGSDRPVLIAPFNEAIPLNLDSLRLKRHDSKKASEDYDDLAEVLHVISLEFMKTASGFLLQQTCLTKVPNPKQVYNRLNAVTTKHRQEFERHKPKWPSEPLRGRAKNYVFVSPAGDVMKVRGLRGICQACDLNPSHLSKVARGL